MGSGVIDVNIKFFFQKFEKFFTKCRGVFTRRVRAFPSEYRSVSKVFDVPMAIQSAHRQGHERGSWKEG